MQQATHAGCNKRDTVKNRVTDDTPFKASILNLPFLQDAKVIGILGFAESGMQSTYIPGVVEPADNLITKIAVNEEYESYKSILAFPFGEYE